MGELKYAFPLTTAGLIAIVGGPIEAALAALVAAGVACDAWFFDWAGGLVWLAIAAYAGPQAERIRTIVDRNGGHATLVRATEADRAAVPVFHPQPAPLAALAARVKAAFDPEGLFSPGRMVATSNPAR